MEKMIIIALIYKQNAELNSMWILSKRNKFGHEANVIPPLFSLIMSTIQFAPALE